MLAAELLESRTSGDEAEFARLLQLPATPPAPVLDVKTEAGAAPQPGDVFPR